jgi:NADH-quinone oxidoreductase subunit J
MFTLPPDLMLPNAVLPSLVLGAINWHSFLFLLFAGIASGFALGVLFSNNVVRMAFYLIVSLTATAGLFILAGAKFVGAMQIMIYVGGTLVLLIFGVMLTAQAAFVTMRTRSSDWVLAVIGGGALLSLLVVAAVSVEDWRVPREDQAEVALAEGESATELGWGLIGVRVDQARQGDETLKKGMSGYLLPFEIVSIHLLVVLIGAAYLARTRRKVTTRLVPGSLE